MADTLDPDLQVAMLGGQSFVQRLDEMVNAKTMLEEALGNLSLGKQAKAAYDDAVEMRAQAQAFLDKAKEDAAKTVAGSRAAADQLLQEANDLSAKIKRDAELLLADTQDNQAKAITIIKAHIDEQRAITADLETKLDQVEAMKDQLLAGQLSLQAVVADAVATKAKWDAAYSRLRAAFAQATEGLFN